MQSFFVWGSIVAGGASALFWFTSATAGMDWLRQLIGADPISQETALAESVKYNALGALMAALAIAFQSAVTFAAAC